MEILRAHLRVTLKRKFETKMVRVHVTLVWYACAIERWHGANTIRRKNRVREISKCYAHSFAPLRWHSGGHARTHKRSKNGTKIAHPVQFFLLLDFVAPYWLSALPP
jgi:hypothetical protein